MLQFLKAFDKKIDSISPSMYVFWTTLAMYFWSLSGLSTKTLTIYVVVLAGVFFYRFKDIRLSLFLVYITSSFFDEGKTYAVTLLSESRLLSELFPGDVTTYLTFKPGDIIVAVMLGLLVSDLLRRKITITEKGLTLILLLFFAWSLLGSVLYSLKPGLSIFMLVQRMGVLVVFLYFAAYYKKMNEFLDMILSILAAMVIFQGFLVLWQYLIRDQIGLNVEMDSNVVWGVGSDEDGSVYRPMGSFGHPNQAADFFLAYLMLFVARIYRKGKIELLMLAAMFFSLLGLIVTNSRSAWVVAVVMFGVFYMVSEKRLKMHVTWIQEKYKYLMYLLLVGLVVVGLVVFPSRILLSFNSFDVDGGVSFRNKMNRSAMKVIERHPWWGSGYETNILAMYKESPNGIVRYVPQQVHNGWLRLISEQGIPSGIAIAVFIWLLIRRAIMSYKMISRRDYMYVLAGALNISGIMLNTLVHTGDYNFGLPLILLSFFVIYDYRRTR